MALTHMVRIQWLIQMAAIWPRGSSGERVLLNVWRLAHIRQKSTFSWQPGGGSVDQTGMRLLQSLYLAKMVKILQSRRRLTSIARPFLRADRAN
jgi:hypothetical protein